MKILFLLVVILSSGCSFVTVDVGIAYDVRADTRSYVSNNPQAYLKASLELTERINLDYIHISSVRTGVPFNDQRYEVGIRDMIGLSYTFGSN